MDGSNFVIGNAIFPLKMNIYVVGNLCLEEEQLISYLTVCYNMLNLNLNWILFSETFGKDNERFPKLAVLDSLLYSPLSCQVQQLWCTLFSGILNCLHSCWPLMRNSNSLPLTLPCHLNREPLPVFPKFSQTY